PETAPVIELDVTDQEHLDSLAERLGEHCEQLDGVLHSIGFAPEGAFNFLEAGWEDVSTALHVSAYSLKALAVAALPRMSAGGSVVGLTFDASFAWPVYDWMGVAKAAFESTNRYLARDLGPKGVRCNL
ncbi:SDR family oxidoreductase, partial [Acinetobacter baumannii]|uniref:SDR family oxidoreductase n=2 Tax=Bacteria TaxID=2 RepID=UPI00189BDB47